ncbi:MAG: hypothetical protein ACI80V_000010 [Rhodothermales bacterium]|jgi:hypothetical protein
MKNQLVQELSQRLDRTGPEVEKALKAFVAAVSDKVQAEGFANLAGLGTLRQGDGGLDFEPSRALQQAVNYRWLSEDDSVALASPNDLETDMSDDAPIRKVSWAPIDGADPTDLTGIPTAPISPPAPLPRPRAEPARASAPAPIAPAPAPRPAIAPSAPAPKAAAPAPPPAVAPPAQGPPPVVAPPPPPPPALPNPVDPGPYAPVSSEADFTYESLHSQLAPGSDHAARVAGAFADSPSSTAYDDALAGAMAAAAPAGVRKDRNASRDRISGSRRPILLGLAAIALIVVSIFVIRNWGSGTTDDVPPGESTAGQEAVQPETTPDPEEGGTTTAVQPTSQPVDSVRTPSGTPASIDLTSSGYTLVVGSSASLAGARAAMNRHANLGHPVGLLSYPDADGQLRHRIGVGEFATSQEADAVRRSLANKLPEGTWVRRIRR